MSSLRDVALAPLRVVVIPFTALVTAWKSALRTTYRTGTALGPYAEHEISEERKP